MTRPELLHEIKHLTPTEQFRLVEEIMRALRVNAETRNSSPRYIKLGGIWKGYSFDFDAMKSARREAWGGLGRGFDE